ncbi:MAG TPA: YlqD family protein [bacterium]|nr:YlqD family protein [bacterium]
MPSITVQRPIVIKTIVTEGFKRLYVADLEDAIKRVEAVVQQIDVQARRFDLERQVSPQSRMVRQQLEIERARQDAARAELTARLHEAQDLKINDEFTQGTIDGVTELSVGDNLFDKISRAEIVVKDGIVMEIREGAAAAAPSTLITPGSA